MRVLITTDAVSGVAQFSLLLAEALADDYNTQVLLVSSGPERRSASGDSTGTGPRPGGGSVDFQNLPMPLESEGAEESEYHDGRQALLRLALEWRAHVLHANEHHLGVLGASGLPVLVASHRDLCTEQQMLGANPDITVGAAYRRRVAEGLHSASLIAAPSMHVVDALSVHYGFAGVVRLIPYGMPARGTDSTVERDIEFLATPPSWETPRSAAVLSRALADIPGEGESVLVGEVQGVIDPAPTRIRCLEPRRRADMLAIMSRARTFVSMALYDPFALQVIDAAFCGCCLVLSDVARYREAWDGAALFVDQQDSAALARVLRSLHDEPDQARHYGELARSRAEARHRIEPMAHSYLTTYQRLALRHGISL